MSSRLVEVDAARLERWAAGFDERHGGSTWVVDADRPDVVVLTGTDGEVARVDVPWPPLAPGSEGSDWAADVAAHLLVPRTALLVLVRRGGYAAGTASGADLLEHAVGTRYVQGRTAAGGWSQQRFARRRSGQTAALAGSATDAVLRVLSRGPAPDVVVVGGDRALVVEVLADPRLARVAALPRGPLLDVPDPRLAVLHEALRRSRCVRIRVTGPGTAAP